MLAIITVGNDKASQLYVRKKKEKGVKLGVRVMQFKLHSETLLTNTIKDLNKRDTVTGILLQLPLPDEMKDRTQEFLDLIDPKKDVDCLTTYNQGRIMLGHNDFLPCTTQAVLNEILSKSESKKDECVIVVGRSTLVTKPLTVALINEGYSVRTYCSNHSWDWIRFDLDDMLQEYKKVHFVSGIGKADYFDQKFFSGLQNISGLYLYDIGMNRDENGKLCGDIERDVKDVPYQTPVPGGIGPQTVQHVYKNLEKLGE